MATLRFVASRIRRSGEFERRRLSFCWGGAALLVVLSLGMPVRADEAATGLRLDAGRRTAVPAGASALPSRAEPDALATAPAEASEAKSSEPAEEKPKRPPTHRKGPAPRSPQATLPAEVPLPPPDAVARRIVAEGPDHEEARLGPNDEQLEVLRDVEEVLFPKSLRGLDAGWSWDLPEETETSQRAKNLGLPLVVPRTAASEPPSAVDAAWLASLTMPDLPIRLDRRVVTYLKFYRDTHRGRTVAAIWAKKSGRYVPEMKASLKRAGLPTDLVWLSLIESGHNPTIRSPAGAMGLWQFMPHSGRMYGLTVDRWVDERRDPARSTQAAVRFLGDLYQRFGNWELAMGAYNMGYAGMSRAIEKFNSNDYWTLTRLEAAIPWETTLYVPKIFALAIVMNNRDAFGLTNIKPDPPIAFDTILVEPGTPLEDVAKAAGVARAELESINAQYIAGRTPPAPPGPRDTKAADQGRWPVKVPRGSGERALTRLSKTSFGKITTHRVRLGEGLPEIARDHGLEEDMLRRLNSIGRDEALRPGTVLLVPRGAKTKPREAEVVVVSTSLEAGPKSRIVYYRVQSGDRLEEVAAELGVSTRDLCSWNALDLDARLRSGMVLQAAVPEARDLSMIRVVDADHAKRLVAGSPEFHEYFEGLKGKKRLEVVVQRGDTLSKVGRRYGMSVGSMERVNRKSRQTKLVPGETLVVYTEMKVSGATRSDAPEPLPEIEAPRPDALPELPTAQH